MVCAWMCDSLSGDTLIVTTKNHCFLRITMHFRYAAFGLVLIVPEAVALIKVLWNTSFIKRTPTHQWPSGVALFVVSPDIIVNNFSSKILRKASILFDHCRGAHSHLPGVTGKLSPLSNYTRIWFGIQNPSQSISWVQSCYDFCTLKKPYTGYTLAMIYVYVKAYPR